MRLLLPLVFGAIATVMQGQTTLSETSGYTLPRTAVHHLHSKVNAVDYKLYISLPADHGSTPNKRYPVLYLLDADYSFAIAKNIVDHLSERNHLRDMLVVGIAYGGPLQYRKNRTRDYTPTRSMEAVTFPEIQQRFSGGGPNFRRFITEELDPYMAARFGGSGFKAIAGHSYGGLFVSWLLTQHPTLFDGYIIVSPSLWYDDHLIERLSWNLSSGHNLKVYCGVGSREVNPQWNMPQDLERFVEKLKSCGNDQLDLQYSRHDNETHNSVFPAALSNGIRHVFDGH